MRSMSVQTGTVVEKIVTPLPIFAPIARRYHRYSGEPANIAHGLVRMSVLTAQSRR